MATYKRREQTEHEREHQLDADLCRPLFGGLTPLGARHLGVRSQRLRDAGAEPVGLNQHGDERPDVVHLRARREVLERLQPRLAGPHLGGDQPHFLGQRRVRDVELVAGLDDGLIDASIRTRCRRSSDRARPAGRCGSASGGARSCGPARCSGHEPDGRREQRDSTTSRSRRTSAPPPANRNGSSDLARARRRRRQRCSDSRPRSSRRRSADISLGDFGTTC